MTTDKNTEAPRAEIARKKGKTSNHFNHLRAYGELLKQKNQNMNNKGTDFNQTKEA